MRRKSYKIRNMEDILKAVSESNNPEGFLKDFEEWLKISLPLMRIPLPPNAKISIPSFTWNNDGKYGKLKGINLEIKSRH